MSVPLPNNCFINNIEKLLYCFLWDGKPEKINRGQLTQSHLNGGLNMPNIYKFVTALKITWLRRLIIEQNSDWSNIFQITHSNSIKIIDYGPNWMKILSEKNKNAFWKKSLELIYRSLNEINVVSDQDVLSVPLWYNENVSRNNMFKPYMYKKGSIVIENLLQEGNFLSKEDLEL